MNKQNLFWKEYFKDFQPNEDLSIKISENETKDENTLFKSDIGKFKFKIDRKIERRGKEFIEKEKIILASLLYSVWGILLSKYTNSHDVVFGTTVSGRNAKFKGIENMVDLFINTLPLRINTKKEDKLLKILQRVKQGLQERQEYESSSLVKIKEASGLRSDESLFRSLVVIENYPLDNVLNNQNSSFSMQNMGMENKTVDEVKFNPYEI